VSITHIRISCTIMYVIHRRSIKNLIKKKIFRMQKLVMIIVVMIDIHIHVIQMIGLIGILVTIKNILVII